MGRVTKIDAGVNLLSPAVEVGESMMELGFAPARIYGVALKELYRAKALGILWDRVPPKKILFGLITKKQPRPFVGVIWFENSRLGAFYKYHWVLEADKCNCCS